MWTKHAQALGLIMARLCYPPLHQHSMQELRMHQSTLTLPRAAHLACLALLLLPLALPTPAELSRQSSV